MSAELDLRGLHQPHEPDPAFVDALEQRLEGVLEGTSGDAPAIEDDTALDLYPRVPAARPERRSFRRVVLGAAATVVLLAVIGVIVRREEPVSLELTTTVAANGWVAQSFGNIWLVREGEPDRVVNQEGAAVCPAFSPDGERLMYGRGTVGGGEYALEIVTVAADGRTSPLRTIPLDEVFGIPCAIWSPDGRWAALGGGGAVWVVDTETGDVRRLDGYAPTDLEWRPGTDELAITGRAGADGNSPIDIYTVSTGDVRTIEDVEATELTWSPDGTTIAYTQVVPGAANRKSGVSLVEADGTNQRPLTTDDYVADAGIGVVWSPRGDQIAYQRGRADCTGLACNERSEVVLVTAIETDPDTPVGTERAVPPIPDDLYGPSGLHAEPWSANSVTWSPDGTELLYSAGIAGLLAVPVDPARPAIVLSSDGLTGQVDDLATSPWIPLQQWQPVP